MSNPTNLERAAWAVAMAPPTKGHAARAGVPWYLIYELRDALTEAGYDVRGALKRRDDERKAENRARREKLDAALAEARSTPHEYRYTWGMHDTCEVCGLPQENEVHT